MSAADEWLASAVRMERARVRSDAHGLIRRSSQIGQHLCRKHPIASVAAAGLVAAGVVGVAAARGGDRKRRRSSGLLRSSIARGVRAYVLHVFTSSLAKARGKAPAAEESSRA